MRFPKLLKNERMLACIKLNPRFLRHDRESLRSSLELQSLLLQFTNFYAIQSKRIADPQFVFIKIADLCIFIRSKTGSNFKKWLRREGKFKYFEGFLVFDE